MSEFISVEEIRRQHEAVAGPDARRARGDAMTADLRARLEADRAELVKLLAETPTDRPLEGGFVAMLAEAQSALAAVEAMGATETSTATGRRVVMIDNPGMTP